MKPNLQTKIAISDARDLIETFDNANAPTIEFDSLEYVLKPEQMHIIAKALYLADCLIYDLEENENR